MTDARSNWKEISLGELGKWITGSTPKSSNPLNFGNDVDFVTPSDISYGGILGPSERQISHLGASSVRKVKAPSVNLVCIGTIGKVALARREVTTNQQINSLEVDRSVADPNFVMWMLSSPEIQEKLWESASSTTVAILNKGNLEKIKTRIPPLPEQQKIAEILEDHLSRLDAALADVKHAKLKSAQFRRSLLQAAFTGNLTGDGTHVMTELPDGWKIVRFGDTFKVRYGKAIDKALRKDSARYPVVGSAGIMTYTDEPLTEEPTIVIGRKGNVGSIQIFEEGCYPIDTTYYMQSTSEFNIKFLTLLLTSLELVKLDSSTATPSLRREDLENVSFFVPPLPEQQKIVEILEHHLSRLDASFAIADAMEKQSASLRRSLLQAAFTGQLTKEVASV